MLARNKPVLLLDVSAHARGLRVSLLEKTPGTYRTVVPLYHHTFDATRVRVLNRDIYAILNRANRRGDIDRGSHSMLRRTGQLLFDELLPVPVKDILRTSKADDLLVCIDDDLVYLPWELLHTGHSFLSLRFNMGRIVRTDRPVIGPPRVVDPYDPLEMLVICDPRDDLMASYYEGVSIRDDMDAHRDQVEVALKSSEVDVAWVQESIRDYDVVHYAGHADYVARAPHDSGWKLAGSKLTSREVLKIAGGQAFPLLVFANACRSGAMTATLLTEKHGEGVFGLANAFLLAGVQHFIGSLWDIPDESACHFALAFYRELMTGETVGASLRAARRELVKRYGDDSVLWGSYVYYGDPTYSIFRTIPLERPVVRRLPTPVPVSDNARPTELRPAEEPARRRLGRLRGPLVYALPEWEGARTLGARVRRVLRPAALVAVVAVLAAALVVPMIVSGERPEKFHIEVAPPTTGQGPIAEAGPIRPVPLVAAAGAPVPAVDGLRAEAKVVTQIVDASGHFEESEVLGDQFSVSDGFQIHFRVNRPAYSYVLLVGTDGGVVQMFPSPRVPLPTLRDTDAWAVLPGPDGWYRADQKRGLYTVIVAASRKPAEGLRRIEGDLESIRNKIVRESPLVKVRTVRVPLGDEEVPDEQASSTVTVTQIDPQRLERELSTRLRQSFESVYVKSFRLR